LSTTTGAFQRPPPRSGSWEAMAVGFRPSVRQ
jgi:hypothetical protein